MLPERFKETGANGRFFTKQKAALNTLRCCSLEVQNAAKSRLPGRKTKDQNGKREGEGRGRSQSYGRSVISAPHQSRTCQPDEGGARLGVLPLVTAGPASHSSTSSTDSDPPPNTNLRQIWLCLLGGDSENGATVGLMIERRGRCAEVGAAGANPKIHEERRSDPADNRQRKTAHLQGCLRVGGGRKHWHKYFHKKPKHQSEERRC